MRSAWRTVEKRCEIRIVVTWRVAARMRSKISARRARRAARSARRAARARRPAHRAQRARERDALPLPAGEVGAARIAAREHGLEVGEVRGAGGGQRRADRVVGRAGGRDVVAQRQLEADEVLEHRGDARAPGSRVERAQIDAVDLDRAGLRVVEPAQQLGERGLAGAVLTHDRQRRAGGDRQVEAVEHRQRRRRDSRSARRGSGSRARACRPPRARGRRAAGLRAAHRPAASRPGAAAPRRPARPRRRAPTRARRRRSCWCRPPRWRR